MQEEPIISVSGLRGIIGRSVSPEVAARFVAAFAAELGPGPIVLTRDGRATGQMLADGIRGVLAAVGRSVLDAGIAATPTTGVLVRHAKAAGGVQISASHNPPEYNGLKLFSPEGRVITAAAGQKVIDRYRTGEPVWVTHDKVGSATAHDDAHAEHLRLVLSTVNVDRIRERHFKVLLDSNHGAGSILARRLLAVLGCETTICGGTPDGHFEHTPEPTAENLAGVLERVREAKADVGFCQDPDADRLALIDATGRYIGEEYTLALCVDHVLSTTKGAIVTNCSTSRMTQDVAAKHGVAFARSAVGEANVVAMMVETNAVFGGEGNGGPIDPRVGYVRDSFVGMAQTLDAMAATGKSLAELAAGLPRYEICKTKVTLEAKRIPGALDALARDCAEAQADRMDGLRLDWPDRWLLVRASNTEPIVRAVAEAPTAAAAAELCERAGRVMLKG